MNQWRAYLTVAFLLSWTTFVGAQDEQRELANLERELDRLRLRVDGLDETTTSTLTKVSEVVTLMRRLDGRIDQTLERFDEFDDRIAANRAEIDELKTLIEESTQLVRESQESVKRYDQRISDNLRAIEALQKEIRELNETVKVIVKTDNGGRSRLDILGNMQDPEFRDEFTQAIQQLGFQRAPSSNIPGQIGNRSPGGSAMGSSAIGGNATIGQSCPCPPTVRRVLRPIGIDYSTGCTIYQEQYCY